METCEAFFMLSGEPTKLVNERLTVRSDCLLIGTAEELAAADK